MNEYFIDNHAAGCFESKKDLRDFRLSKEAMSLQLPEEYEVEHSEIKDQGQVCSCVAHSVCEILEIMNYNEEKYSTNWIYGYRPFGSYQRKGMFPRQAVKTPANVGYVLYDDFKGNDEMNGVKEIVDRNINFLKDKAKDRKTYSYARLVNRNEIKKAIYLTGYPVLICIHCCKPFSLDENNVLIYSDKFQGFHALVCYGWNKDGLLIQNSWGENWGNNGCAILPDNYPITEAWMIANSETSFSIVKPKNYFIRKVVQKIINIFRKDS